MTSNKATDKTSSRASSKAADSEQGRLYVVAAPSGAGKTSLVKALMKQEPQLGVAISHTTRPQRREEKDGLNYHFVDKARFRQMIEADEFLEWAEVFGNLYGTSKKEVNRLLTQGQHLILEIDWQGAQQIRRALPDARTIFILPPSYKALHERLLARAQDDAASVERRMASALEETSHYAEFDYLIVNDSFETALEQMNDIIKGRGEAFARQPQEKALAGLLDDLLGKDPL